MAVVDRESAGVTLREAFDQVTTQLAGGVMREVNATVTPAADDTSASVHRFCSVPSNARVSQVLISAADAGTAGAYNIGIYETDENGGAAVDVDLFASAFDLSTGPFTHEDITFESGEYTYAETEQFLWEVLGLTEDPLREYIVTGTISTTFDGGPTLVNVKVRYVI